MTETYRERATKAEQENARLRDELARRPNYEWFVELIRRHLGQSLITPPQHLAHQVKQLKEARGVLVEERLKVAEALSDLLWPNMAIGNKAIIQAAINLLKSEDINGTVE